MKNLYKLDFKSVPMGEIKMTLQNYICLQLVSGTLRSSQPENCHKKPEEESSNGGTHVFPPHYHVGTSLSQRDKTREAQGGRTEEGQREGRCCHCEELRKKWMMMMMTA